MAFHSEIPESQNAVSTTCAQNVRLDGVTRNAGQADLEV
jgi:hypothetical protein